MNDRNYMGSEAFANAAEAAGANGHAGRAGTKKSLVRRILAAALLIAVTGTFALTGRQDASAEETPKAGTEEAAENRKNDPVLLFRDGDYSGQAVRDGKDSDGLKLPKAGAGEKLYIGYADLPHVGMTKVALVLSADGKNIHDICIFLKDFDNKAGDGTLASFSSVQTSNSKDFALPVADESLGDSKLMEISMDGDLMFVRMDYSFKFFGMNGKDSRTIHIGETEFWMKQAG